MSPLTDALRHVAHELYPAVPLDEAARFKPLFDISKGDVSSAAAIHIARITRGSATGIADQMIERLPQIPHARWISEQGYIILARAPLRLLCEEAESLRLLSCEPRRGPVFVTCLVPDVTVPLYARLRLIACAGFQAMCNVALGRRAALAFVPGDDRSDSGTLVEVATVVEQAVKRAIAHAQRSIDGRWPSGEALPRSGTVWTAHHFYDRLDAESKSVLARDRASGSTILKMPADGWLLARERGLSDILSVDSLNHVVSQLTTAQAWLTWIAHGVSTIPSGDFDPSVALLDECASPCWSVQALAERFTSVLRRSLPAKGLPLPLLDVPEETMCTYRPLLLRAIFAPYWLLHVADDGGSVEGMAVVEELAREGHAFLNAPGVRLALENGSDNEDVDQILAGLGFALSTILPAMAEVTETSV